MGKAKRPTTPTETLREMLKRQRKTTDLIMNKNPCKRQAEQQEKPPEVGTRTNPETAPPLKPPVQYRGGNQTKTLTPREGRTPPGRSNALGYRFFIPQDSEFRNSILPVMPRTSGGGEMMNLKTLILAMREAQKTTRDLINVMKDKNNNGDTKDPGDATTTASRDNKGEAKELDTAINALVNAQWSKPDQQHRDEHEE